MTACIDGMTTDVRDSKYGDASNSFTNTCWLCKEEVTKVDKDIIAMGPRGQRDVRNCADPSKDFGKWNFYHRHCVVNKGHAPNHPVCNKPNGPCTDWHLRGKCKRGFDCGHCHLEHPELMHKYPDLPPGGVLRRPQRRERLAMLKQSYEAEINKFLQSGDGAAEDDDMDALAPRGWGHKPTAPKMQLEGDSASSSSAIPTATSAEARVVQQLIDHLEVNSLVNPIRIQQELHHIVAKLGPGPIQIWLDALSRNPELREMNDRLMQEADREFEKNPSQTEASLRLSQFFERCSDLCEVLWKAESCPRGAESATFEDILDFILLSESKENLLGQLTQRCAELCDLLK